MQRIKKIICTTDLSKVSCGLLFRVLELSKGFGASLFIFHSVCPPRGSVTRQIEFERGGEKEATIKRAHEKIKTIMEDFDSDYDLVIAYGDPVLELIKSAKKIKPDIVIAASYGLSGFQKFLIGSVIGRMAQTLLYPLLVIPPDPLDRIVSGAALPKLQFVNISIACSLSESDAVLKKYGVWFLKKFNSKIHLVHVMESPVNEKIIKITSGPYEETQRRLEEKLAEKLSNIMSAKIHILHGIPGEELAAYAKNHEIDLIIAGRDSRPGRIITSTTAALLRHSPCVVLTVPIKSD